MVRAPEFGRRKCVDTKYDVFYTDMLSPNQMKDIGGNAFPIVVCGSLVSYVLATVAVEKKAMQTETGPPAESSTPLQETRQLKRMLTGLPGSSNPEATDDSSGNMVQDAQNESSDGDSDDFDRPPTPKRMLLPTLQEEEPNERS